MSDELVQTTVEIPRDAKELIKDRYGHGGLSRVIREAVDTAAFGADSDLERLKSEADETRNELNQLRREKQAVENRITDKEAELRLIEERIDAIRDSKGEYEGALQVIENTLHDDPKRRVFVGHGEIERAAALGNCSQEDVLNDLKDRNPSLDAHRFEEKGSR